MNQKMKAVVIRGPGKLEFTQVDIPKPKARQVRIKVQACGVCHSDSFAMSGEFPGSHYPVIPGHEVIGTIDELGPDTHPWKLGQRVGVGWSGFQCGYCHPCRQGDLALCENTKVTGIHIDGGYAEYMVAYTSGLASVPDDLSSADAAPLLCAGVTTFNSLRHAGAEPGDLVAIAGIGGLGHLALQFSNKMGYNTVAISRSKSSEQQARELGAKSYIATDSADAAAELQKLGGAKVVLATAPSGKLISSLVKGLGNNGSLMVVAAPNDPISVSSFDLILKKTALRGWASGVASDSEDTMQFATSMRVRPMIEKFPLEKATEAYQKMMSAQVKYRAVLIP
jgi:2-desacetyl-2-hydroxyethyl bacteriochlorophyllide A dehydrogenase